MMHLSTKKFSDLQIVGLAAERCHTIEGSLVRVHFRLSSSPPLGWSYVFTTVWQSVQYALKRPAGVEGDVIWIDCVPEEVGAYHLEQLENAVAKTNDEFRAKAHQQSLDSGRQAQLEAQLRSQIANLNRTLYPAAEAPPYPCAKRKPSAGGFFAKVWTLLWHSKKRI